MGQFERALRRLRPWAAGVCAAAMAGGLIAPPAHADDFVSRASGLYASIRADRRSDRIILPAVRAMTPPPPSAATPVQAALLPTTSGSWAGVLAWLEAPPQRAALEALDRATADENPSSAFAFAQPYGVEGVEPALVRAGLYTELGEPPTLSAARHLYLPALSNLGALAHAETTRLVADGKIKDALEVMTNWLFFARQIADREFAAEKRWGMDAMLLALERLRDIAWQDARSGTRSLDADFVRDYLRRMRDREGPLGIERLRLPQADRIGAQQTLERVFLASGAPNPDTFGQTLATIGSREHPLRLFSETAAWDATREGHAPKADALRQLDVVADDWVSRWGLADHDPVRATPSDFEKLDRARFGGLALVLGDMRPLFALRQRLRTEAVGTRAALGMHAFVTSQGTFPRDLSAIRPRFIPVMEDDPYATNPRPLEFFVPGRDQGSATGTHTIAVYPVPPLPDVPFSLDLTDDRFVIYSLGPDDRKEWARNVTQDRDPAVARGDYLLWPPVMSLLRQHMVEKGLLP